LAFEGRKKGPREERERVRKRAQIDVFREPAGAGVAFQGKDDA